MHDHSTTPPRTSCAPPSTPAADASTRTWVRAGDPRHWREIVQTHPVFGDDRLSLVARGVYSRITMLPVGESFSAESLAAIGGDSVAVAQACLDELMALGYLAEVAR
ncbi:hypothetical protein [Streptomyces chumphonensis]|uniref:hypothetical protein n=1 Tax=Streptomyces chumphonensis TaxID=1214925 RepID=UPI003D740EC9